MSLLKAQYLDINEKTGKVKLINQIDLDPVWEENYLERMAVGKAKGSNWKPICSIPQTILENDPDGAIFLNTPAGSIEGRLALKRFLAKGENWRYKTSTANI
jgi:hypothetical protein